MSPAKFQLLKLYFCLRPSAKDQGITRVVVVVVVLVFVLHLVHILIETAGTANSAILWISSAKLPVNNFGMTYLKSSFTCAFLRFGSFDSFAKEEWY